MIFLPLFVVGLCIAGIAWEATRGLALDDPRKADALTLITVLLALVVAGIVATVTGQ